jgi:hypothetical protein
MAQYSSSLYSKVLLVSGLRAGIPTEYLDGRWMISRDANLLRAETPTT